MVGTLVRLGLAAVWLLAGLPKIFDLSQNYVAIKAYELLPDGVASVVASGQPFLEVALGVLLVLGIGTRLVGVISAVLLLIYIAGIISVWARGLSIDCGCFSSGGAVAAGQTHYGWDIARDVGYVVLSA
ncbi:MAG: MauE/DoxX family redox-associated membrane protein, partial [Sciscionella sp.]